ncbi:UvrD-helicase domain-containing protein [Mariniblastus fucicola]|uniref:DNA 3'-5' helicase n=1 Tax=Mariniblastus fucicola TaxID=980251 RepID=A0A5B9P534_9BACT|nr:UvrD-helicase domain-containing protein [Mariniblastus fucicola]QEG21518.1 ATP-dependent helicase/nuclease subunit A [Mariniblastus fucicola]
MVDNRIPTETAGVFENIVIRASAGTGKTFQLSNRYLNLLVSGVDCQEILATTFTKKGAGEILDRIIQRLSKAALSAEHASRLQSELGVPLEQDRAAEVLQKLLRNLHRLEIGTLDSFFNRVARVFSLELGLPPAWDIVDEQQIEMLSRRTIHDLLRQKDVATLLPLVAKGESSRKIATLVRDVVKQMYMIRRESQPEAWDRLEEVKTFLSDDELSEVTARAEAMKFDKKNLTKTWDAKMVPMIQQESWSDLAEQTWFVNVLEGTGRYGRTILPEENIALVQALIRHCRAWITTRLIKQNRATCALLGLYGERLESIKAEMGQMRFEDVTERLVEFVAMWNTDRFAFRLDHQIRHLLLDEFQDTSPTQWNVIEPFAKAVCHSNDPLRSFFCVGDMKQAIFGWRGGVAEIFDLVERKLDGLDKAEPLSTSYRSSQVIIDFVNDVFMHLDDYQSDSEVVNRAVHGWEEWFNLHSTAKKELGGHVTVEYASDATLETKKSAGSEGLVNNERNENLKISTVERVRRLHETLPADKTIGVLVPTNKEVGQLIFMLQSAGIRASEEGGTALTDSAAVEIVLSALKLADHPGDSIARFHLSHSPLAKMFELEPETVENQSANRTAAVEGAAMLRERLVQEGYGPTIESLARTLAPSCTKRELLRLQHLVRLAYSNRSDSQRWSMRPNRFVEYVREEVKIADASSARVRVMTVHKSKGLEFDAVVLPMRYLKNGWLGHTPPLIVGRPTPTDDINIVSRYANVHHRKLLPDSLQEIFEDDQERTVRERMCNFYVAVTRAVHSLHIVCSYGHKPHGKTEAGVLLALLCPELIEKGEGRKKDKVVRKEGLLYERGDANWFQAESGDAAKTDEGIDSAVVKQYYSQNLTNNLYRPLSRAAKSMRGMARVRPSMLEGGNRVRLSETLTSPDREMALEFGELMHCCFEQIRWLDEGESISDGELRKLLKEKSPGSGQIEAAIKRFRELLQFDNLKNLLSSSSVKEQYVIPDLDATEASGSANRIEVHTEKRLAVLMDQLDHVDSDSGSLIEGTVDRLVLVYEDGQIVAAEIIDFKVDHIDDSNLTGRIEFYRPQLTAYRAAVEKMLGLAADRIATRLVFVQSGQVIQVDSLDHSVDNSTDLKLPRKKKLKPPKAATKRPKKEASEVQQTFWSDDVE